MNGSIELIFHVDANKRKLRIIYLIINFRWLLSEMGMADSIFNEWINQAEFWDANTYLKKLNVTLIVIGAELSNMGVSF